ncbi:MAG: hypothetical protein L3J91_03820, partial [Thermoplasmata archaeon]|nr:hypothetical protein [Thermoplasmata archaeon]
MGDDRSPHVVRSMVLSNGLEVARQSAPAGAASFAASIVTPAGTAYDPSQREGTALLASVTGASAAGSRDRVE